VLRLLGDVRITFILTANELGYVSAQVRFWTRTMDIHLGLRLTYLPLACLIKTYLEGLPPYPALVSEVQSSDRRIPYVSACVL